MVFFIEIPHWGEGVHIELITQHKNAGININLQVLDASYNVDSLHKSVNVHNILMEHILHQGNSLRQPSQC